MKNTILRILISASLLSLISGIVVVIIGLMLGWKTSIQFSDGFFWAGALMIFIGFVSYQGYSQRPVMGQRSIWTRLNAPSSGRQTLFVAKTSWPSSGFPACCCSACPSWSGDCSSPQQAVWHNPLVKKRKVYAGKLR